MKPNEADALLIGYHLEFRYRWSCKAPCIDQLSAKAAYLTLDDDRLPQCKMQWHPHRSSWTVVHGFRIGFIHPVYTCKWITWAPKSALLSPQLQFDISLSTFNPFFEWKFICEHQTFAVAAIFRNNSLFLDITFTVTCFDGWFRLYDICLFNFVLLVTMFARLRSCSTLP